MFKRQSLPRLRSGTGDLLASDDAEQGGEEKQTRRVPPLPPRPGTQRAAPRAEPPEVRHRASLPSRIAAPLRGLTLRAGGADPSRRASLGALIGHPAPRGDVEMELGASTPVVSSRLSIMSPRGAYSDKGDDFDYLGGQVVISALRESHPDAAMILQLLDVNNDGTIDATEVTRASRWLRAGRNATKGEISLDAFPDQVHEVLKAFDLEGNDRISIPEIGAAAKALIKARADKQRLKKMIAILIVMIIVFLGAFFGLTWLVIQLQKEVEVDKAASDGNPILADTVSHQAVRVASMDYFEEEGSFRSRSTKKTMSVQPALSYAYLPDLVDMPLEVIGALDMLVFATEDGELHAYPAVGARARRGYGEAGEDEIELVTPVSGTTVVVRRSGVLLRRENPAASVDNGLSPFIDSPVTLPAQSDVDQRRRRLMEMPRSSLPRRCGSEGACLHTFEEILHLHGHFEVGGDASRRLNSEVQRQGGVAFAQVTRDAYDVNAQTGFVTWSSVATGSDVASSASSRSSASTVGSGGGSGEGASDFEFEYDNLGCLVEEGFETVAFPLTVKHCYKWRHAAHCDFSLDSSSTEPGYDLVVTGDALDFADEDKDAECDDYILSTANGYCECGSGWKVRGGACGPDLNQTSFRCADLCLSTARAHNRTTVDLYSAGALRDRLAEEFRLGLPETDDFFNIDEQVDGEFSAVVEDNVYVSMRLAYRRETPRGFGTEEWPRWLDFGAHVAAHYAAESVEAGGGRLLDLSGKGRHATVSGSPIARVEVGSHDSGLRPEVIEGGTDQWIDFPDALFPPSVFVYHEHTNFAACGDECKDLSQVAASKLRQQHSFLSWYNDGAPGGRASYDTFLKTCQRAVVQDLECGKFFDVFYPDFGALKDDFDEALEEVLRGIRADPPSGVTGEFVEYEPCAELGQDCTCDGILRFADASANAASAFADGFEFTASNLEETQPAGHSGKWAVASAAEFQGHIAHYYGTAGATAPVSCTQAALVPPALQASYASDVAANPSVDTGKNLTTWNCYCKAFPRFEAQARAELTAPIFGNGTDSLSAAFLFADWDTFAPFDGTYPSLLSSARTAAQLSESGGAGNPLSTATASGFGSVEGLGFQASCRCMLAHGPPVFTSPSTTVREAGDVPEACSAEGYLGAAPADAKENHEAFVGCGAGAVLAIKYDDVLESWADQESQLEHQYTNFSRHAFQAPPEFECAADGSVCFTEGSAPRAMPEAILECREHGARVCGASDMALLCAAGLSPYEEGIWLGDKGLSRLGEWGDAYLAAETSWCSFDPAYSVLPKDTELNFRCCRAGDLATSLEASCPAGLQDVELPNGEICASDLKAAADADAAIAVCQNSGGYLCTHAELNQLCAVANPFDGAERGWTGDKVSGGKFGTWHGEACTGENDGSALDGSANELPYRCCGKAGFDVDHPVAAICEAPFALRGGVCYADPEVPLTADGAIDTCSQNYQAHICTHSEMQEMCGSGFDPYGGAASGWYGDAGSTDGKWGTWNKAACHSDNDGAETTASPSTVLPFRCCRDSAPPSSLILQTNSVSPTVAAISAPPSGYTCTSENRLCYKPGAGSGSMETAMRSCADDGARVCSIADVHELCGAGVDGVLHTPNIWLSNFGYAAGGDGVDEFYVSNGQPCGTDVVGAPQDAASVHPYSCCRSGELLSGVAAECPQGFQAGGTENGELCSSDLKGPSTIDTAIATCGAEGGHVCEHAEMQTLCGVMNPFTGVTNSSWYGDHGRLSSGDWDDEFRTSAGGSCEPGISNDGGVRARGDDKLWFRCCAGAQNFNYREEKTHGCPSGFSRYGGVCYKKPPKAASMHNALTVCATYESTVCTHRELQAVCAAGGNPFALSNDGWFFDKGTAAGQFQTWSVQGCSTNAGTGEAPSSTVKEFRCCRPAADTSLPLPTAGSVRFAATEGTWEAIVNRTAASLGPPCCKGVEASFNRERLTYDELHTSSGDYADVASVFSLDGTDPSVSDVRGSYWTMFHVARYGPAADATRKRIFQNSLSSATWFDGFDAGRKGVANHHDDYVTVSEDSHPGTGAWVLSTSTEYSYRSNFVDRPLAAHRRSERSLAGVKLAINTASGTHNSDFQLAELLVLHTAYPLEDDHVEDIERMLFRKHADLFLRGRYTTDSFQESGAGAWNDASIAGRDAAVSEGLAIVDVPGTAGFVVRASPGADGSAANVTFPQELLPATSGGAFTLLTVSRANGTGHEVTVTNDPALSTCTEQSFKGHWRVRSCEERGPSVRVVAKQESGRSLILCEVEVFAADGSSSPYSSENATNIALGRPATMTHAQGNWTANFALDGKIETCARRSQSGGEWTVMLPVGTEATRVVVHTDSESGSGFLVYVDDTLVGETEAELPDGSDGGYQKSIDLEYFEDHGRYPANDVSMSGTCEEGGDGSCYYPPFGAYSPWTPMQGYGAAGQGSTANGFSYFPLGDPGSPSFAKNGSHVAELCAAQGMDAAAPANALEFRVAAGSCAKMVAHLRVPGLEAALGFSFDDGATAWHDLNSQAAAPYIAWSGGSPAANTSTAVIDEDGTVRASSSPSGSLPGYIACCQTKAPVNPDSTYTCKYDPSSGKVSYLGNVALGATAEERYQENAVEVAAAEGVSRSVSFSNGEHNPITVGCRALSTPVQVKTPKYLEGEDSYTFLVDRGGTRYSVWLMTTDEMIDGGGYLEVCEIEVYSQPGIFPRGSVDNPNVALGRFVGISGQVVGEETNVAVVVDGDPTTCIRTPARTQAYLRVDLDPGHFATAVRVLGRTHDDLSNPISCARQRLGLSGAVLRIGTPGYAMPGNEHTFYTPLATACGVAGHVRSTPYDKAAEGIEITLGDDMKLCEIEVYALADDGSEALYSTPEHVVVGLAEDADEDPAALLRALHDGVVGTNRNCSADEVPGGPTLSKAVVFIEPHVIPTRIVLHYGPNAQATSPGVASAKISSGLVLGDFPTPVHAAGNVTLNVTSAVRTARLRAVEYTRQRHRSDSGVFCGVGGSPMGVSKTQEVILLDSDPCACKAACEAASSCKHWVYYRSPSHGKYRRCYYGPFSALLDDEEAIHVVSGSKAAASEDGESRELSISVTSAGDNIEIAELAVLDGFLPGATTGSILDHLEKHYVYLTSSEPVAPPVVTLQSGFALEGNGTQWAFGPDVDWVQDASNHDTLTDAQREEYGLHPLAHALSGTDTYITSDYLIKPCLLASSPRDQVTTWAFDPVRVSAESGGVQRSSDSFGLEIESLTLCRRIGTTSTALNYLPRSTVCGLLSINDENPTCQPTTLVAEWTVIGVTFKWLPGCRAATKYQIVRDRGNQVGSDFEKEATDPDSPVSYTEKRLFCRDTFIEPGAELLDFDEELLGRVGEEVEYCVRSLVPLKKGGVVASDYTCTSVRIGWTAQMSGVVRAAEGGGKRAGVLVDGFLCEDLGGDCGSLSDRSSWHHQVEDGASMLAFSAYLNPSYREAFMSYQDDVDGSCKYAAGDRVVNDKADFVLLLDGTVGLAWYASAPGCFLKFSDYRGTSFDVEAVGGLQRSDASGAIGFASHFRVQRMPSWHFMATHCRESCGLTGRKTATEKDVYISSYVGDRESKSFCQRYLSRCPSTPAFEGQPQELGAMIFGSDSPGHDETYCSPYSGTFAYFDEAEESYLCCEGHRPSGWDSCDRRFTACDSSYPMAASTAPPKRHFRVLTQTAQPFFHDDQYDAQDEALPWIDFEFGNDDTDTAPTKILLVDPDIAESTTESKAYFQPIRVANAWTGSAETYFSVRTDEEGEIEVRLTDEFGSRSLQRKLHILPFTATEARAFDDAQDATGFINSTLHHFSLPVNQKDGDPNDPYLAVTHKVAEYVEIMDETAVVLKVHVTHPQVGNGRSCGAEDILMCAFSVDGRETMFGCGRTDVAGVAHINVPTGTDTKVRNGCPRQRRDWVTLCDESDIKRGREVVNFYRTDDDEHGLDERFLYMAVADARQGGKLEFVELSSRFMEVRVLAGRYDDDGDGDGRFSTTWPLHSDLVTNLSFNITEGNATEGCHGLIQAADTISSQGGRVFKAGIPRDLEYHVALEVDSDGLTPAQEKVAAYLNDLPSTKLAEDDVSPEATFMFRKRATLASVLRVVGQSAPIDSCTRASGKALYGVAAINDTGIATLNKLEMTVSAMEVYNASLGETAEDGVLEYVPGTVRSEDGLAFSRSSRKYVTGGIHGKSENATLKVCQFASGCSVPNVQSRACSVGDGECTIAGRVLNGTLYQQVFEHLQAPLRFDPYARSLNYRFIPALEDLPGQQQQTDLTTSSTRVDIVIEGNIPVTINQAIKLPESIPFLILRDPPGGGSSATFEKGSAVSVSFDVLKTNMLGTSHSLNGAIGVEAENKGEAEGLVAPLGLGAAIGSAFDVFKFKFMFTWGLSAAVDFHWALNSGNTVFWHSSNSISTSGSSLRGTWGDTFVTPSLSIRTIEELPIRYDAENCTGVEYETVSTWQLLDGEAASLNETLNRYKESVEDLAFASDAETLRNYAMASLEDSNWNAVTVHSLQDILMRRIPQLKERCREEWMTLNCHYDTPDSWFTDLDSHFNDRAAAWCDSPLQPTSSDCASILDPVEPSWSDSRKLAEERLAKLRLYVAIEGIKGWATAVRLNEELKDNAVKLSPSQLVQSPLLDNAQALKNSDEAEFEDEHEEFESAVSKAALVGAKDKATEIYDDYTTDTTHESTASIISFGGGGGTTTYSFGSASHKRIHYNFEIDASFSVQLGFDGEFLGFGIGGPLAYEGTIDNEFSFGWEYGEEMSTENTVTFTFEDNELGDLFDVAVGLDEVYGTPVFKTIAGRSKCMHESGTDARSNYDIVFPSDNLLDLSGTNSSLRARSVVRDPGAYGTGGCASFYLDLYTDSPYQDRVDLVLQFEPPVDIDKYGPYDIVGFTLTYDSLWETGMREAPPVKYGSPKRTRINVCPEEDERDFDIRRQRLAAEGVLDENGNAHSGHLFCNLQIGWYEMCEFNEMWGRAGAYKGARYRPSEMQLCDSVDMVGERTFLDSVSCWKKVLPDVFNGEDEVHTGNYEFAYEEVLQRKVLIPCLSFGSTDLCASNPCRGM